MSDNFRALEEDPTIAGDDVVATQGSDTWKVKLTLARLKTWVMNTVESLTFDTTASTTFDTGVFGWDADNHTYSAGIELDSVLQLGMESVRYIANETGAPITDGQVVYFGVVDSGGHMTVGLTDASSNDYIAGVVTTASIADDAHGYVTKEGTVRNTNITGLTIDLPIYADPTTPGGMTNTLPTYPNYSLLVGKVVADHGDGTGDIEVNIRVIQREVPTPVVLSYSSPAPSRNAKEDIHGGLTVLATAHDLNAGPLTLSATVGIGKLIIVVNSASPDCDITVNGTQVNRDTGTELANQDSVITVDAVTTDTSGSDTNGNDYNDLQGAYITDKWFTGIPLGVAEDVVITGTGTTIPTDIDVYQVSFEQFNDAKYIEITTADMTYFTGAGVQGTVSAYIYTIEVTGDKVNLTNQGSHVRSAAQHTAEQMYRIRRGEMGLELVGTTDGVFITIEMSGSDNFTDVGIKLWGNVLY